MNSIMVIGIAISSILGIASFIASNNIIVGVVCLAISILYFFLIARPTLNKYQVKVKRFRNCYHFINNFIVSLSIKGTITQAYESAISSMPIEFIGEMENVEEFTQQEKLEHLRKIFRFHVYSLFVDLISLYEEQGGNIIDMSHYLLEETRNTEEYISKCLSISKGKLVEFTVLWIMTIGVMVFMRFAVSQFFQTISNQLFFPIGIGAITLFCLFTIHLAITRLCKLEIKGWDDHEKI